MEDYLLIKAKTTLGEARLLLNNLYLFGCINRLYYAVYYTSSAFLFINNIHTKTHKGLIKQFNQLSLECQFISQWDKTLLQTLFDYRQESDYGDFITLDLEEVENLTEDTFLFFDRYKNEIRRLQQTKIDP